jgi:hypothetical protein
VKKLIFLKCYANGKNNKKCLIFSKHNLIFFKINLKVLKYYAESKVVGIAVCVDGQLSYPTRAFPTTVCRQWPSVHYIFPVVRRALQQTVLTFQCSYLARPVLGKYIPKTQDTVDAARSMTCTIYFGWITFRKSGFWCYTWRGYLGFSSRPSWGSRWHIHDVTWPVRLLEVGSNPEAEEIKPWCLRGCCLGGTR